MNLTDRLIVEEYRKNREDFLRMGQITEKKLKDIVARCGVRTFAVQQRVKSEKSLAGKLVRYEGRFGELADLTDILGARVICYFNDDIDRVGKLIEQEFDIDWERSSDKRELIDAESFGYLSLHYICCLPKSEEYPEELCRWRFEIQVRTCLQHVWSDIEHDMGYKSEFGVPRPVQRGFARISALLELADDEFARVRSLMVNYTESVRTSIIEGTAGDVPIDMVSLAEYVHHNKPMRAFLDRVAQRCEVQIEECDPSAYVAQLEWLGVTTIGQLSDLLAQNEDMALKMFEQSLSATDLDIISSSSGLRYLCQAEVCRRGLPQGKVAEFLALSLSNTQRAATKAAHLQKTYARLMD